MHARKTRSGNSFQRENFTQKSAHVTELSATPSMLFVSFVPSKVFRQKSLNSKSPCTVLLAAYLPALNGYFPSLPWNRHLLSPSADHLWGSRRCCCWPMVSGCVLVVMPMAPLQSCIVPIHCVLTSNFPRQASPDLIGSFQKRVSPPGQTCVAF